MCLCCSGLSFRRRELLLEIRRLVTMTSDTIIYACLAVWGMLCVEFRKPFARMTTQYQSKVHDKNYSPDLLQKIFLVFGLLFFIGGIVGAWKSYRQ